MSQPDAIGPDDLIDPSVDDLPESPPDRQEHWKGMAGAAAAVDRSLAEHTAAVDQALSETAQADRLRQRVVVVGMLEAAAIQLRDCELAVLEARKGYQAALGAFNRFVAPVPTGASER